MRTRFVIIALLLAAGASGAQQAQPITMQEAVRIALQGNPALRQARNAQASSAMAVQAQKLSFLPDLRASASSSQGYSFGGTDATSTVTTASSQTARAMSAGLSTSVTLFDGFANVAGLRGAKLSEQASAADVKRAEQTVVYTVASNYLDLVNLTEQLRVQRENLAAQEAQEREIQAFVSAGRRPISDLYTQQASVAASRATVADAENAVALAKVALMGTLGLDPRASYDFAIPAVDTTAAASAPGLDSLLALAIAQRTDLRAQQARVGAAAQDVKAAGAARLPTVSLSAGYNTAYTSAADAALWNQLGQRQGGSVGLGVSIPLFDRGSASLATQRASIQQSDAQIALETQGREVGLEVRRAYLDLQAAGQKLAAADAQLRAARQALDASQARYRVGAATLVELTQSRAALTQAESALISARYGLAFQRARLDYAVGD